MRVKAGGEGQVPPAWDVSAASINPPPHPGRSLSQPMVVGGEAAPTVPLIQHHQPPVDGLEQLQGLALGVLCGHTSRGHPHEADQNGDELKGQLWSLSPTAAFLPLTVSPAWHTELKGTLGVCSKCLRAE